MAHREHSCNCGATAVLWNLGNDCWWNIIQLIGLRTRHFEETIAGALISDKHTAACMSVGKSTFFFRIISQVISQIFVYLPLREWKFQPLTQWQLGQYFLTHAAIAEFLRGKESVSMPTEAFGWNSSLVPWRPRRVFLDLRDDDYFQNESNCCFSKTMQK